MWDWQSPISILTNVILDNLLSIFLSLKLALNFVTLLQWDISIFMLYIHRLLYLLSITSYMNEETSVFDQTSYIFTCIHFPCVVT